jgi:hypothetical protein
MNDNSGVSKEETWSDAPVWHYSVPQHHCRRQKSADCATSGIAIGGIAMPDCCDMAMSPRKHSGNAFVFDEQETHECGQSAHARLLSQRRDAAADCLCKEALPLSRVRKRLHVELRHGPAANVKRV